MGGRIEQLLSDPKFNFGVGLLGASGPTTEPQSFGGILGQGLQFANQARTNELKRQFLSQRNEQDKRRKEALERLPSLLGDTTTQQGPDRQVTLPAIAGVEGSETELTVPSRIQEASRAQTPEGRQELLGLLGDIAPEQLTSQLAQGLLGGGNQPRDLKLMQSLGFPLTQEGFAQFQKLRGSGANSQLEAMQRRLEIDKLIDERKQQRQDRQSSIAAVKDDFINATNRADKLLEANNTLEGTMLESGLTMQDARGALLAGATEIRELFGKDTTQARKAITARNTFRKEASGFAIDLVSDMENATNRKFTVLRNSIANLGVDPQTNRRVIGEVITSALQTIDRENIDIPKEARDKAIQAMNKIQESERRFQQSGSGRIPLDSGGQLEITDG